MFPLTRGGLLVLIGCLALIARNASAYVLNGYSWPFGADVVMHLGLTGPPANFQDGSSSWNASAADAVAIWSQNVDTVAFIAAGGSSNAAGDGVNSAFFSDDFYGQSFGSNTLAVAIQFSPQGSTFTETDVIFNTAKKWATYRGPVRFHASAPVYDLRRVALHEFGHVLGLDHPDERGQSAHAIMNSVIGDLDDITSDDIAGVRRLYGTPDQTANVGTVFSYQVRARISAATFSATGLPPGLSIDAGTGWITGAPTLSGTYDVTIFVSGAGGNQTIRFVMTIRPTFGGSLLRTFPLDVAQLVADPARSRVYATVQNANSVAIIDTLTLTLIKTVPVGSKPFGLSISADGRKLWVANRSATPAVSAIDLETLEAVAHYNAPQAGYDVEEGFGGRLYVSTAPSAIQFAPLVQIDLATGQSQLAFAGPNYLYGGGLLATTPDRRTLFYGSTGSSAGQLSALDVSASPGALRQTRNVVFFGQDLAITPDGRFLAYPGQGGTYGFSYRVTAKLHAEDLNIAAGAFAIESPGPVVFGASGALLYHVDGSKVLVFDTNSFNTVATINLAPSSAYYLGFVRDIAVDNTGATLFYAVVPSGGPELQVYSTGLIQPSPVEAPRPKSLKNVSTRLRTQTGDNVAIGGFVIEGSGAKKVIIRAIGPSLPVTGPLGDPVLSLYRSDGQVIVSNDNWNSHRAELLSLQLPPPNEREAAIIATLQPGAYTAILRGLDNTSGVALVEVFDVNPSSASRIKNLSTRGRVETGDNVMIGGFVIAGDQPTRVVIRALGPSLTLDGVPDALQDPTLDLFDANGTNFASNDDWHTDAEIATTGLPPRDGREAAIVRTLPPGAYTAIVRGKDGTSGVALVELYNLEP